MTPSGASVRLDATVIGRVQGVGFRYFVLREAMALGLERLGGQHARTARSAASRRGPRDQLETPAGAARRGAGVGGRSIASASPGCPPPGRSARSKSAADRTRATDPVTHRTRRFGTAGLFRSTDPERHAPPRWSRTLPPRTCLRCTAPSSTGSASSRRPASVRSPTGSGPRPSRSTRGRGTRAHSAS